MPIVAAVAVPHPPIILPEIGKGEEEKISQTTHAYRAAMTFIAQAKPDTVVVISPHADSYSDYFHLSPGAGAWGDFARFGAPRAVVEADYDAPLAAAIVQQAQEMGLPAGFEGEKNAELDHGTTIPLMFLGQVFAGFKVVRIGLSGLPLADHYRLGQCIATASNTAKVAVIGSGDLSHKLKEDGPYGFAPEGPQLDKQICAALEKGDFGALMEIDPLLADKGAECGLRSFVMMAGALDGRPVEPHLLSYEGPFGVGYGVATFRPFGEDETRRFLAEAEAKKRRAELARQKKEDTFVSLARYALESYVQSGKRAALPGGLPAELAERQAGVFVSLNKDGQLRGCIGTTSPTTPCVAQEILQNAVYAGAEDPRFDPVRPEELDELEIKVDVLGDAEQIASEKELDPKRYGVIVQSGARRGLLLPDLDGVDTAAQQVAIARQKAGIGPGEAVELSRFEVVRHR